MKEKLLLFIPIFGTANDAQIQSAIAEFRKDYPHLRTVEEVSNIDYNKQFVKIILIHITDNGLTKTYRTFVFTNTSGRTYKSISYQLII